MDRTLPFIPSHSGEGSSVIFDYMYPSLLDGTVKHYEVSKTQRNPILKKEMLAFGIPEGAVETLLGQRGFCNIQNADHVFLHKAYFTGVTQRRNVTDGYVVVAATVNPKKP